MIGNDVKVGEDIVRGKSKAIMNEIIASVMKAEKNGISQTELLKRVDMHRDSLRRYMNTLMDHGLVTRNSKKGKYHINPIYFSRSDIGGMALCSCFLNEVLGEDNIAPKYKRLMIGTDYYSNINEENKSFGIMFDGSEENILKEIADQAFKKGSNDLQKSLYEFAMQIGIYHIYVYLLTLEKYHFNDDFSQPLTSEGQEWLNNALSSHIVESYHKFRKRILNDGLDKNQKQKINLSIKENNLRNSDSMVKILHAKMSLSSLSPIICGILQTFQQRMQDDNKIMENDLLNFAEQIRRKDP
jgi:predicted transcriptional regulator